MLATMESGGVPSLESTRGMAWKWILEKVVHCADFGTTFLKELMLNVPDIEAPLCQPLLERVAVRYLEEAVVSNQLNGEAIPLMQTLAGYPRSKIPRSSSVKERFNRELVLWVKTEAVLSFVRGGEKDWAGFSQAFHQVFPEEENDLKTRDRQRELALLLIGRNQSKETLEKYFRKYSLENLQEDLHKFLDEKKESFQMTFLDQLVRDFLENKLPSMLIQDLPCGHIVCYRKENSLFGGVTRKFQGLEKAGKALHGMLETSWLEKPGKPSIVRTHQNGKVDTNGQLQRQKVPHLEESRDDHEGRTEGHEIQHTESKIGGSSVANPTAQDSRPVRSLRKRNESGKAVTESSPLQKYHFARCRTEDPKPAATQRRHEEINNFFRDSALKSKTHENLQAAGLPHAAEFPMSTIRENGVNNYTGEAQLLQLAGKQVGMASGDLDKNQCELSEKRESIALTLSEIASDGHEEHCHKCKEAGMLFCCDGCPIAMHGNCLKLLGLPVPELQDDWFCPVCTEKTAKDLVALAEQVAAEAKGKLELFLRESSKKHCHSEGSMLQQEKLNNPTEHLKTAGITLGNINANQPKESSQSVPKKWRHKDVPKMKHGPNADSALRCLSTHGQQVSGCKASSEPITGNHILEAGTAIQFQSAGGKLGIDNARPQLSVEEQRVASQRALQASNQITNTIDSRKKRQSMAMDESFDNKEGISSGRHRIQGVRRKTLPWTIEEEDVLKEGVKRFSVYGNRGFQWKSILDFGYGKFDLTRTTVDLKDKWRNLLKGLL